jgi:hypothetical protein
MDDILLVMKTGATEALQKLPIHLLTTLKCVPEFLLFSDMVRTPSSPVVPTTKAVFFGESAQSRVRMAGMTEADADVERLATDGCKGATNRTVSHLRRT